ncbi:MAG TPA: ParB/RepB/Spo0J family partition protein [Pirellulales bacterium]|nr:ParB/RepB/Spo0J family partition protein [Pirellulales bacterium]
MKEEVLQIPLDKIDFAPQVREVFDEALIVGLAANIEEAGQLVPVLLFPVGDRYGIEDGERRCRALKHLGRKTVAAIVKEKPPEAKLVLRQLSCDLQNVHLSPIERAAAMERLMALSNWKGNELAAKTGVSTTTITRLLALLTLPEPIRQALKEGRIPASAGYELAKIEDVALQADMAQKLMDGKVTRDAVAGARKAARRKANDQSPATLKRLTAVLGAGRAVTVAMVGDTLDDFIGALEEALAKARKGRTQGFALDTLLRLLRDQAA